MKKKIFRTFGIILILTAVAQCSATRVDSLVPVFVAVVAMVGAVVCFGLGGVTDEKGDDENDNRIL